MTDYLGQLKKLSKESCSLKEIEEFAAKNEANLLVEMVRYPKDLDILERLLKMGADPNNNMESKPLRSMWYKYNRIHIAKWKTPKKRFTLFKAISKHNSGAVALLLKYEANIDIKWKGRTPLKAAKNLKYHWMWKDDKTLCNVGKIIDCLLRHKDAIKLIKIRDKEKNVLDELREWIKLAEKSGKSESAKSMKQTLEFVYATRLANYLAELLPNSENNLPPLPMNMIREIAKHCWNCKES